MILSPKEGLCHSYRSIHPHKMVRQVAAGPLRHEALQMQDSRRLPVAGAVAGLSPPSPGGHLLHLETRSDAVVRLFKGLWLSTSGRLRYLRAEGQEARRRLRTRGGLGRRCVWSRCRLVGGHLPGLLTHALAFARRLILCHMRRAGLGSRCGLPFWLALCVWRIIAQAWGCIWAGRPT